MILSRRADGDFCTGDERRHSGASGQGLLVLIPEMADSPRRDVLRNGALSSFWAYVLCPACGGHMRHPFSRFSGPVAYVHSRCATKLIVTPDRYGKEHRAVVVPQGTSLEHALEQALKAA